MKKPAPPTYRDYPDELAGAPRSGYLLHFRSAKQSATRAARIERVRDRIMEGFGLRD